MHFMEACCYLTNDLETSGDIVDPIYAQPLDLHYIITMRVRPSVCPSISSYRPGTLTFKVKIIP